jgi:hypothetical protein
MSRATAASASQARRGVSGAGPDRAADALRQAWGQEYDIGFADGAWRAYRLDGGGNLLTGPTPDELATAIRADWAARTTR